MDGVTLEPIAGDPPRLRLTLREGDVSLSKDFLPEEGVHFFSRGAAMANDLLNSIKEC